MLENKKKITICLVLVSLLFILFFFGVFAVIYRYKKIRLSIKELQSSAIVSDILKPEINFPLIRNSNNNNNVNRENTIIVSHFSLNNSFISDVIDNHQRYAKKHGYDYWFRNGILDFTLFNLERKTKGLSLAWQKMLVIKQAMDLMESSKHQYEWVMWIDGDAVFADFNQDLEKLKANIGIKKDDWLIIAKDFLCNKNNNCPKDACVNSGVLLIRNNINARKFVDSIIKSFPYYKNRMLVEQSAINDYVFGLLQVEDNEIKVLSQPIECPNMCNNVPIKGVQIVPSKTMNACYRRSFSSSWKAGDFIAHFAGMSNDARGKYIKEFLTCINTNQNLIECE